MRGVAVCQTSAPSRPLSNRARPPSSSRPFHSRRHSVVIYPWMASERILIIDDERLVRWSLRQKCEEWGYQVFEAENGESGLRLAAEEPTDLALCDVRMPDLTGLE